MSLHVSPTPLPFLLYALYRGHVFNKYGFMFPHDRTVFRELHVLHPGDEGWSDAIDVESNQ